MVYNAKDVKLSLSVKEHTKECSTHKTTERFLYVSEDTFNNYVEGLFPFSHTIGDCIGYHEEDTPLSTMKAKISFLPDGTYYLVENKDYKEYKCDCNGEIVAIDLNSGWEGDTFLTIEPRKTNN